jgi:hypothetical protein
MPNIGWDLLDRHQLAGTPGQVACVYIADMQVMFMTLAAVILGLPQHPAAVPAVRLSVFCTLCVRTFSQRHAHAHAGGVIPAHPSWVTFFI